MDKMSENKMTTEECVHYFWVGIAVFAVVVGFLTMLYLEVKFLPAYLAFIVACIVGRFVIIPVLTSLTMPVVKRWPGFFQMPLDDVDAEVEFGMKFMPVGIAIMGAAIALVCYVGVVWGSLAAAIAFWCLFFAAAAILHLSRWVLHQWRRIREGSDL